MEHSTVPEIIASRTVVVSHPNGLCLRGASAICKLANVFDAKLEIVKGEQRIEASDALQVVLLAADCGSHVTLEATGPGAEEAVDALATLFAKNFGLAD